MIIACIGYAGHGKTTVAKYLQELCLKYGHTNIYGFADSLKDEVAEEYKINRELFDTQEGKNSIITIDEQQMTLRELLISHSIKQKKILGNNYYASLVLEKIENEKPLISLIHDLRFESELNSIENSNIRYLLIRINNPNKPVLSNYTEHELDNVKSHFEIKNNSSLFSLYNKVDYIFSWYILPLIRSLSEYRKR